MQQPTNTDRPAVLGVQVNSGLHGTVGVIGDIDQSATGNTILRIGQYTYGADGWVSAAHVVLTPEEREQLIAALIRHRQMDEVTR